LAAFFCLNPAHSNKPQSLSKKKYSVCGKKIVLEVADNSESRSIGLMHRTSIAQAEGMLFVFAEEQVLDFWMRNVIFDIDIGYFNKKGVLVSFHTMTGTSPLMKDHALPRYSSKEKAVFAVETTVGFFAKKDINQCRISPVPNVAKK